MNWQVLGMFGWGLIVIGWLLQRPSVQHKLSNFTLQIGSGNQSNVTQVQSNQASPSQGKADSALSQWGSWASIVGLALTVYPLINAAPK